MDAAFDHAGAAFPPHCGVALAPAPENLLSKLNPDPPAPDNFWNPRIEANMKAILATTKALVARRMRPPKKIGMRAMTLAPMAKMIGAAIFLIFPRPIDGEIFMK